MIPDSGWLAARQNGDGGWPYLNGGSAVEPTTWALLALEASGAGSSSPFQRGVQWLAALQRPDGGWPPRANVDQSTWVTGLPLLLPKSAIGNSRTQAAQAWLLAQSGRESSFVHRLRMILISGSGGETDTSHAGWPWFAGTAAWVMPTSLTVLALRRLKPADAKVSERTFSGAEFLIARRCSDGGWNHGATKALGYEAESYPETTGVALLALAGHGNSGDLAKSLATAERHLAETPSREAASWLQLALTAHGKSVGKREFANEPRSVHDGALAVLASLALEGRNVFTV